MNAAFQTIRNPIKATHGVCTLCNGVHNLTDLDQSAHGDCPTGKVYDLETSLICNDCMNDCEDNLTECAGCPTIIKRDDCAKDSYGDNICFDCQEWNMQ